MSTGSVASLIAVSVVVVATLLMGSLGFRLSRTTSDFFVASRTVSPWVNASAIGGEYLSAASFLGIAGLVFTFGADMLWLPVGYTAGYMLLLVLVAAPLRRSGAYTLPDFAQLRFESEFARTVSAVAVLVIGWLYLMPQLRAAGLALSAIVDVPTWMGACLVAVVVVLNVVSGGMRSITFVQAFQYWLKLAAIIIPAILLLLAWRSDGAPLPSTTLADWAVPLSGYGGREHALYQTYSLIVALFFGTMGLPHVLVRFYTNPDGAAARRTTFIVIGFLGVFYLFPPLYGLLGRIYIPDQWPADTVVLALPAALLEGQLVTVAGAILVGGAFAAFLSTASGLAVSVAGVLSHDLFPRRRAPGRLRADRDARLQTDRSTVTRFRWAAVVALIVPLALSLLATRTSIADTVGMAFAMAASTFCPLLLLGIWWRGLSRAGAMAGLISGGVLAGAAAAFTLAFGNPGGWTGALLAQPAAWSMPLSFIVMITVSLLTPASKPRHADPIVYGLHAPEGTLPTKPPATST
ncbi:cation acetate symporter [Saxibacter everestensis]|uniref:Cation acetate symporter n=1 Tax=Saxibacter everestensis TaxID=2909229 RepID=A0ABY8QQ46_9MICO|nr:cation acetate symporter [Brevibacteriaceae bacterium ZFBP1038]